VYNSLRRINIIVKNINTGSRELGLLLVIKAKKGRATLNDIIIVKTQVFSIYIKYIIKN
jgi:hypothetical protein